MTKNTRLALIFAAASLLGSVAVQSAEDDAGFHNAIIEGKTAKVREYLARGRGVNAATVPSATSVSASYPLELAIMSSNPELVRLFIEKGANVNQVSGSNKFTPLMIAPGHLKLDLIQLLIDKGARVNVVDEQGMTPLLHAAYYGNVDAAKLFLDKGADPKVVCPSAVGFMNGGTALHKAALGDRVEMLKFLGAQGFELNAKNDEGLTPLMVAAKFGKPKAAKWLIDARVDLDAKTTKAGKTALMLATEGDKRDVLALLTAAGATASPGATPPPAPATPRPAEGKPIAPGTTVYEELVAARKLAPPAKAGQRVFVNGEWDLTISRDYEGQKYHVIGEKIPFSGMLIELVSPLGWVLSVECVGGIKEGMETRTSIKTGKLLAETTYRAGKRNGAVRTYYDSGQLKTDEVYKDDQEEGLFKSYRENGKIQNEGNYRKGHLHGQVRYYWGSGKLQSEQWYRDGREHGPFSIYKEDGVLQERGFYENGVRVTHAVGQAADAPALSGAGNAAALPPPVAEPKTKPTPAKPAAERIATPGAATPFAKQALTANNNKQYAEALKLAEQGLQADPNDEGAVLEKGKALRDLGRVPEAIATLEKALTIHPDSAKLHFTLGFTYSTKAQQPQKAVEQYEASIRLDPNSRAAHNNLGAALLTLNQTARAETVLRRAVELDSENLLAHRNLGRALMQNGKVDQAVAEFEACLRIQPGDSQSQKYLQDGKAARAKSSN